MVSVEGQAQRTAMAAAIAGEYGGLCSFKNQMTHDAMSYLAGRFDRGEVDGEKVKQYVSVSLSLSLSVCVCVCVSQCLLSVFLCLCPHRVLVYFLPHAELDDAPTSALVRAVRNARARSAKLFTYRRRKKAVVPEIEPDATAEATITEEMMAAGTLPPIASEVVAVQCFVNVSKEDAGRMEAFVTYINRPLARRGRV